MSKYKSRPRVFYSCPCLSLQWGGGGVESNLNQSNLTFIANVRVVPLIKCYVRVAY